jgi:ABC-type lipoprotein release transport system permease subunit
VVARTKTVLSERHNHEEDFTVTTQTLHLYVPALPVDTPMVYAACALVVSLGVGLASGLMPARRAAALDPVVVLTAEWQQPPEPWPSPASAGSPLARP